MEAKPKATVVPIGDLRSRRAVRCANYPCQSRWYKGQAYHPINQRPGEIFEVCSQCLDRIREIDERRRFRQ